MKAGALRHRLRIESPTTVIADDGGAGEAWQVDETVWGAIHPLTMRESVHAAAIDARLTHRIVMRGRTLPPTYRLGFGGRIFHPTSVRNLDERGIQLEILAMEIV